LGFPINLENYYSTQNEIIFLVGKTVGSTFITIVDVYAAIGSAVGAVGTAPTIVGTVGLTHSNRVFCNFSRRFSS
jgi:hypothetical protein